MSGEMYYGNIGRGKHEHAKVTTPRTALIRCPEQVPNPSITSLGIRALVAREAGTKSAGACGLNQRDHASVCSYKSLLRRGITDTMG